MTMKLFTHAAAISLLGCVPLAAFPSSKLAAEWHVPSSPWAAMTHAFTLVDEGSGTARVATMAANGTVAWPHTVPTGVTDVSDVTAGIDGPSGEVLAVTSPAANRVVLVDIESTAPYARLLPPQQGIGTAGVGTFGSAGTRELLIASSQNGSVPGMFESIGNPGTDAVTGAEIELENFHPRRLQPISTPGSPDALALFSEGLPGLTSVGLATRDGRDLVVRAGVKIAGTLEFATQVASHEHPDMTYVVGHAAGDARAHLLAFALPMQMDSNLDVFGIALPFPPSGVMPVVGGGHGPLDEGFIVISEDGTEARLMRVDASGENIEDTGHHFDAEPGTALAGLAVIPGRGMVKLNAPAPGMPSTTYNAFQWDGNSWVETDSGAIPELDDATASSAASLLYFDAHPLLAPRARLLGVQTVRDWTSLASYPDDLPESVFRENFSSPSKGLVPTGKTQLFPPSGTQYVVTNQPEPGLSITALGALDDVLSPQLAVAPPSGTYSESFQVTATFEADHYRLRYRRDGGDWLLFHTAVPVAWTTTMQFTLEDLETGALGPIVTREYTLPAEEIADNDSNGDGVPDYVKAYFGLDPFGSADSDGDGFSDLDEILQGANPADPTDLPTDSLNISTGGGMSLVASALDPMDREIAVDEDMVARRISGNLLARAPIVDDIDPPLPDGTDRGAELQSSDNPPFRELIAISTPIYFNNDDNEARSGREIIRHVPADPPPEFSPNFTPTAGMSLEDAAQGWIAAAIAEAASHPAAAGLTMLEPVDGAVSVLLEHLVYMALDHVRPDADPAPTLGRFTFFPGRSADSARESLDAADLSLLRKAGFDFREALALASDATPDLEAAATSIYQRHVTNSATTPGMVMPIDALRVMLRGGSAPDGYVGAALPADLNAARNAYNAVLADLASAFRPFDTWAIEIPESPSSSAIYQRLSDGVEVVLLHPSGERFILDQGLGLRPGSQFTVAGFTDTAAVLGRPTMEVVSASLTFEPTASDTDEDGNLLDDEWEKFFFGATGQDAFSEPHGNGYSLLQYFLTGTDPRGGELPPGPAVDLRPQLPIFEPSGDGGYTLDFVFPSEYRDAFAFVLERSETMEPGSFIEVPEIDVSPVGGDELRATIPEHEAPPGRAFYRIRLSLKPST